MLFVCIYIPLRSILLLSALPTQLYRKKNLFPHDIHQDSIKERLFSNVGLARQMPNRSVSMILSNRVIPVKEIFPEQSQTTWKCFKNQVERVDCVCHFAETDPYFPFPQQNGLLILSHLLNVRLAIYLSWQVHSNL